MSSDHRRRKGLSRYFEAESGPSDKRYHSSSDVNLPEDISDPHTWRDESTIKRREWLARNKRALLTFLALGLVALIVLLIWFGQLIPQIIFDERVQILVGLLTLISITFLAGIRFHKSRATEFDWLILPYRDRVVRYLGYYSTSENGTPMFIPVKGFTLFGFRANPMTLGDMSTEMARQFAKSDRKADDPAKIRLHSKLVSTAETNFGTVVCQFTEALEPDEFGMETDIEAKPPTLAPEDTMLELKTELEEQTSQNAYLKDQVSMLRDQKKNYKEMALATEKEIENRMINFAERVMAASQGRSTVTQGGGGFQQPYPGGFSPTDGEPDYGGVEDEIEEELNDEF